MARIKEEKGDDQVELLGNVKLCTSIDKLCEGLHDNFKKYIKLCRNLKFEERPDYDSLRNCFNEIAENLRAPLKYQWVPLKNNIDDDNDND